MDMATRIQILDETVCISNEAVTFRKGMNPKFFPQAMGKIVG